MTQRSLHSLIPQLVEHVKNNRGRVEYANRLMTVDAGQLLPEIETALLREFKPETVEKMIGRIPCINLLTRITDKVSRIYDEPVTRSCAEDQDSEINQFYQDTMQTDTKMGQANRMYNLHESCAIEPYQDLQGRPKLRVLAPNNFLVWSDDPTDPTNPTVFIKFMGDAERIATEEYIDNDGILHKASEDARVDLLYIYSDREFLIVDMDGNHRPDLTPEIYRSGRHKLGRLPIIYVNQSTEHLLPLPNTDTLNNTTLIPILLGDLTFAVKYLSHSIVVVKDMKIPDDIDRNPDAIWDFKSLVDSDGEVQGSVDVLQPKIEIDAVVRLIQTIVATWLESRGIRPGTMGQATGSSRTSALAKLVDEADTTAIRNAQVNKFRLVEKELFDLIVQYHKVWKKKPRYGEKREFSAECTINPIFPEQKIFASEEEKIQNAVLLVNANLATPSQVLRRIFPSMTEKELEAWIKELDEHTRKSVQTTGGEGTKEGEEPKTDEVFGTRDSKTDS